jgi:hypothetical protein
MFLLVDRRHFVAVEKDDGQGFFAGSFRPVRSNGALSAGNPTRAGAFMGRIPFDLGVRRAAESGRHTRLASSDLKVTSVPPVREAGLEVGLQITDQMKGIKLFFHII